MPEEGELAAEETINLFSPELAEEIDVTLTKGQVLYVTSVLEAVVQPRGYQMVEYVYDLMSRLRLVTDGLNEEPVEEKEITPVIDRPIKKEEEVETELPQVAKVFNDNVLVSED